MIHAVSITDLVGIACPSCMGIGRKRDYYDNVAETMGAYIPPRRCSVCNGHGTIYRFKQPKGDAASTPGSEGGQAASSEENV